MTFHKSTKLVYVYRIHPNFNRNYEINTLKINKMVDESTRKTLSNIPLLQTKAGPRDKELWVNRLKEEYQALIKVKRTNLANYLLSEPLFIYSLHF